MWCDTVCDVCFILSCVPYLWHAYVHVRDANGQGMREVMARVYALAGIMLNYAHVRAMVVECACRSRNKHGIGCITHACCLPLLPSLLLMDICDIASGVSDEHL